MDQPVNHHKRARPLLVVLAALSIAAYAQLVQPTPFTDTPVNAWTAAHGALFDAGLSCGTAGTNLADTLSTAECQDRMVAAGVDNESSNIISIYETAALGGFTGWDRRLIGVNAEYVGLDAGAEVSLGGAVSACLYWRPLAGGDAGLPWFLKTTQVLASSSVAGARATGFFFASPFMPGYYCFVPVGGNVNVGKIWMRLERMYQPREIPR